jgi:2-methylcitrate dehydratase PrpD
VQAHPAELHREACQVVTARLRAAASRWARGHGGRRGLGASRTGTGGFSTPRNPSAGCTGFPAALKRHEKRTKTPTTLLSR